MSRIPIQFFITKVHSLCNINCTYCYEYNQGNTGWKLKPKHMSLETFEKLCHRIAEHKTGDEPFISFHGGEPLMRTPEFFDAAMTRAREILPTVRFGMQTNGTLLNEDFIAVFRKHGLHAGISLDGPKLMHDRYRVDHQGRGTFDRVMQGITLMQANRDVWGGILCVINQEVDPIKLINFFAELSPTALDLLEPDGTWEKLPPGKSAPESCEYGEWLARAFDCWLDRHPDMIIRRFEEIIEHCYGGHGSTEYFGVEAANLITVATDGSYEAVDQIKTAYDGAENLDLNIFDHSLDAVLEHPSVNARMIGVEALDDNCLACEHLYTCGGGYYPHRHSEEGGFRNPTIYCADYKLLFRHIRDAVERKVSA